MCAFLCCTLQAHLRETKVHAQVKGRGVNVEPNVSHFCNELQWGRPENRNKCQARDRLS